MRRTTRLLKWRAQKLFGSRTMRVKCLTYNILDGARGREAQITEIILAQNADVILLQEVAGQQLVQNLAHALHADFYIAASNSWRTIAIISRLPLRAAASFHPRLLRHTLLEATLEYAPSRAIKIFGIHLAAPAFTLPVEVYRLRELRLILGRIAQAAGEQKVLAGDLNSIAPGDRPAFQKLPRHLRLSIFMQGGFIARQAIALVRREKFCDAYRALHPDENGFTLPALYPTVRLDYFFVHDALRQHLRACEVVTTPETVRRASDHLPVTMELEL